MRADMVGRACAAGPRRRSGGSSTWPSIDHSDWSVASWRAPLGVVGFVFEGRPNVFADATGVLRTGNTAVFRIGSDALGTARAIMRLRRPGARRRRAPGGAVQLDRVRRHTPPGGPCSPMPALGLAVARGSGPPSPSSARSPASTACRSACTAPGERGSSPSERRRSQRSLAAAVEHSLDRKVCNTINVCCIPRRRARSSCVAVGRRGSATRSCSARRARRGARGRARRSTIGSATNGSGRTSPEYWLVDVDSSPRRSQLFNRHSPRFAASLISDDAAEHDWFYAAVDAPFVGNGFTRWVDGQFALDHPELGLSNWQAGRLFARGGVLSGDSVYTVRLRAEVRRPLRAPLTVRSLPVRRTGGLLLVACLVTLVSRALGPA